MQILALEQFYFQEIVYVKEATPLINHTSQIITFEIVL